MDPPGNGRAVSPSVLRQTVGIQGGRGMETAFCRTPRLAHRCYTSVTQALRLVAVIDACVRPRVLGLTLCRCAQVSETGGRGALYIDHLGTSPCTEYYVC